jgi:hypothetical protein
MYEKHLNGDTSLFRLPQSPSLHLLATNLSEGRLCSFQRNGLVVIRPDARQDFRLDRVTTGLATVAMAVTAPIAAVTSGAIARRRPTTGGTRPLLRT